MGGKSKKQTIGYKYFLGVLAIPCLGPVDALLEIMFDKKSAWKGVVSSGRIKVNKPKLFGGEESEGGVSGYIDVNPGDYEQGRNSYMVARTGANTPAYRGLFNLVFRRFYFGNSPYFKSFALRIQRILQTTTGEAQWNPTKAVINANFEIVDTAVYIAIDLSGSMDGTRLVTAKAAVVGLLEQMQYSKSGSNSVRIVGWSDVVDDSIEYKKATTAQYDAMITFVNGLAIEGGTDFEAAVSQAPTFFNGTTPPDPFNTSSPLVGELADILAGEADYDGTGTLRKVCLIVSDSGDYSGDIQDAVDILDQVDDLDVFGYSIDNDSPDALEALDNTPADGVPVIDDDDTGALTLALGNAFSTGGDMNPAHIIRECITNPDYGLGLPESDVGSTFDAAATTYYTEEFGLSFRWEQTTTIEEFIQLVDFHTDSRTSVDPRTGKFEIVPIRDDYTVEELTVIEDDDVITWQEARVRTEAELINSFTVNYIDKATEEEASYTYIDTAMFGALGGPVGAEDDFDGILSTSLAQRVAERECTARSLPLRTGTIKVKPKVGYLRPGTAFVLDSPDRRINEIVCRVVEITAHAGEDAGYTIKFIQDVFSLAATSGTDDIDPVDELDATPVPADIRLVEEAPYYQLVLSVGQSEADNRIDEDDWIGYLNVSAVSPTDTTSNANMSVDAGSGFSDAGFMDFAPGGTFAGPVSSDASQTKIWIDDPVNLEDVTEGQLLIVGNEYMRIDGIADDAGGFYDRSRFYGPSSFYSPGVVLTVGRGVLDTAPQGHVAGERVIFWQNYAESDETEYASSDAVDVRIMPIFGSDTLPIYEAEEDTVTMNRRAYRPYPPGKFQIDGEYATDIIAVDATLTWAHRDRLQQTSSQPEDHTDGNIGPEAGTTYRLDVWYVDVSGDDLGKGFSVDLASVTTYDISIDDIQNGKFYSGVGFYDKPSFYGAPSGSSVSLRLYSVRDGYDSWTPATITAPLFYAPTGLTLELA